MIGYLLAALVAIIVGVLWYGSARRGASPAVRFERLVALCRGDREMAERLVAGEARRSPGSSARAHIERASARLEADRRR